MKRLACCALFVFFTGLSLTCAARYNPCLFIDARHFKITEKGERQEIATLPGLKIVSPANGEGLVYSNAVTATSNVNVFEVAVPFGYKVVRWLIAYDDPFEFAAGEAVPGSEGATTVTIPWSDRGERAYLMIVLDYDNERMFVLRKSPFGEGTVGTNFGEHACQKGDVFALRAVPAHDDVTGRDLSVFRRWSDGVTDSRRTVTIDTNLTLVAEFVPLSWQVTFDANGGTVLPAEKKVTCDAAYGWLPTPTRPGHSFAGWFSQPLNGSRVGFDTTVGAIGDHCLYARWDAASCVIGFELHGEGNGTVDGVGRLPYGTAAVLTAKPYEGSVFARWEDGETRNPRRIDVTGDATYGVRFDVATFDVTFTYRNAQGEWTVSPVQKIRYGEAAVPPDVSAYDSWPEHHFRTWATEDYKSVTRGLAGEQSVQAIYDVQTYKVTFVYCDRDGNAVTTMPQHVEAGKAAVPPTASVADNWIGHALVGWRPDYSVIGADRTVEAVYELCSYDVTFAYVDGNGKDAKYTEPVPFGETVPFEHVESLKTQWGGHAFKYWSLGNRPVTPPVVVSNNLYVAAVYEGYAHISYDANGAEGEMPTEVYTNFIGQVSLASNAFAKTGYEFTYWSMDGSKETFEDQAVVMLEDGSAYDLKANWAPISYTVKFDGNGGRISDEIVPRSVSYDEVISQRINLTDIKDVPSGFSIRGFSTNKVATIPEYQWNVPFTLVASNLTTVAGDVVTFHAIWQAEKQKIFVITVPGTTNEVDGATDASFQEPDEPQWPGHVFNDWTTNGTDTVGFPIIVPPGGFALTALWTTNRYTVKFHGTDGTQGMMEPQAFVYGVPQKLTPNAYSAVGQHFAGWTNDVGTVYADRETVSNLTTNDGAVVDFYSTWETNRYTVVFTGTDGTYETSGTMEPQAFTYDVAQALTSNGFGRVGHTFSCWTNEAATGTSPPRLADGEVVSNLATNEGDVVTLRATWSVNRYEIRYDAAGGTAVNAQTNAYGAATSAPAEPTKTGYAFDAWYDGETAFAFGEPMPAENLVLTAHWTPNSYTVRFLPGVGGDGTIPDQAFTYDTPQTLAANLFTNSEWKVFDCWTNATSGETYADGAVVSNLTSVADGVVELTAQWKVAPSYTVAFSGSGGTNATGAARYEQTIECGKATRLTANRFTRTGYGFAGWADAAGSGSTVVYTNGEMVTDLAPTNGTATLYATWTPNRYRVVFEGNGATSGATEPQTFVYGEAQALTSNRYVRTGHTFSCWTNDAATGMSPPRLADGEVVSNLTVEADGEVTLFAKWTVNRYEIRYDSAGGSAVNVQSNDYGAATSAPAAPTRGGYAFAGWYAGEAAFTFGGPMPAENLVLTAHWTPNSYTVRFLPGEGGDGTMPDQAFTYDTPQTLAANLFTNSEWKVFDCWTNATSGETYANGATVSNLTSDADGVVELTAQWKVATSYTVAFSGSGGTNATGAARYEQTIECGKATRLTANRFTRTGYGFAGWADAAGSGSTVVYTNGEMVTDLAPTNGTATLYATWTPNRFTVVFDGNGATSGTMEPQTFVYGEAQALTSNRYVRTGHTFSCWTNDAATGMPPPLLVDGEVVSNLTVEADGEVTLRAMWTVNEYECTFDRGDGTELQSEKFAFGAEIKKGDPQRSGYVFDGWFAGETKFEPGMPMPDHDLAFVARWTPISYAIAFDANGGSGTMTNLLVKYDQEIILPVCEFTRDGYEFGRWTNATWGARNAEVMVSNLTTRAGETVTWLAEWNEPSYPLSIVLNTELEVTSSPDDAWKVNGVPADKAGVVRTSADPEGTLRVTIPGPGTLTFTFVTDALGGTMTVTGPGGETAGTYTKNGTYEQVLDQAGTLVFSGTPKLKKTWTLTTFIWTPKSESAE